MNSLFSQHGTQIDTLREAYTKGSLSLYLGAGISVGSGIPDWEQLVAAMYFASLADDQDQRALKQAYRNYLFAIADWYLDRERQPMDVTARKIRAFYDGVGFADRFLPSLKDTLYASLTAFPGDVPDEDAPSLLASNPTLEAVARLCEKKVGIAGVISYNYDNLLKLALKGRRGVQPIWRSSQKRRPTFLPCYHVHGYIPINGKGSTAKEIIFTEEQFHSAANSAYSWSNLVQLQQMASGVGLAIGLSLNDRNLRRLLDAVANTPLTPRVYAVLERKPPARILKSDQNKIMRLAKKHLARFSERARMKTPNKEFHQVKSIVAAVESQDMLLQEAVLRELGVEVLWLESYADLPRLLRKIA